ncbi:hypothetical protein ACFJGW_16760 [Burkholderiaceae bacterium UC74_6]
MIRWILALCSALLLVCVTLQTAAACEPLAQEMGVAVALHDDDGKPAPDLAPELPELFFLPAGHSIPQPSTALPAAPALPVSTAPYLGGLLRPPCPRA